MPNPQNSNTFEDHIQAINEYNLQHSCVIENVCINEFFSIPIDVDTIETIGSDISTYGILKGNSTCSHLPKYIVVVADTMDCNMLSIHTSYDHCMDVSFDSNNYVIYERITDCVDCCM